MGGAALVGEEQTFRTPCGRSTPRPARQVAGGAEPRGRWFPRPPWSPKPWEPVRSARKLLSLSVRTFSPTETLVPARGTF